MLAAVRFLFAQLSLAALGSGAAFHPAVRSEGLAARAAAAFGAGAVALTLEATLFSIAGIPWTVPGLGIPLLIVSFACARRWRRPPARAAAPFRISKALAAGAAVVGGASFLYLALSLTSGSATSVDFLFFWGVKAVRFADARGFSADFLGAPFTVHAALDYPPLAPVVQAWGILSAGKMPWRAAPAVSVLWTGAAAVLLLARLRHRLDDGSAAAVVAFWSAALGVSLAYSYSGGNAEAPLVFFESWALVWLMTEDPGESRVPAILALCGAALTKVEGSAAVFFIALGCFAGSRDASLAVRLRRNVALIALPALCVGAWFLYQAARSLPVGYRAHGELLEIFPRHGLGILRVMVRNLDAGSLWLPWLFAALVLAKGRRDWRSAAPALALAVGLLGFLVFDYLHDRQDPAERIGWTTPRVAQPALSAAVLAAGLVSARRKPGPRSGRGGAEDACVASGGG